MSHAQQLRICFGRRWINPRELAGLEIGSVIDLATPADDDVVVSVSGRPLAIGKAIAIDGKLGVRVSEVVAEQAEPASTEMKWASC